MVETPEALPVAYYLTVPGRDWVRSALGPPRRSAKDPDVWTRSGTLYGARLLSAEKRRSITDELRLESRETMGGELDIVARFPDGDARVTNFADDALHHSAG